MEALELRLLKAKQHIRDARCIAKLESLVNWARLPVQFVQVGGLLINQHNMLAKPLEAAMFLILDVPLAFFIDQYEAGHLISIVRVNNKLVVMFEPTQITWHQVDYQG